MMLSVNCSRFLKKLYQTKKFYVGHLNQSMGAARALSGPQCIIFLFIHLFLFKLHDKDLTISVPKVWCDPNIPFLKPFWCLFWACQSSDSFNVCVKFMLNLELDLTWNLCYKLPSDQIFGYKWTDSFSMLIYVFGKNSICIRVHKRN